MREMDDENSGDLFRGRGFDPSVGAHELSHTVRRESVPDGTIQRSSQANDDWEKRLHEGESDDSASDESDVPEEYEEIETDQDIDSFDFMSPTPMTPEEIEEMNQAIALYKKGAKQYKKRRNAARKRDAAQQKAMNKNRSGGSSSSLNLSSVWGAYANSAVETGEQEDTSIFGKIKKFFSRGKKK